MFHLRREHPGTYLCIVKLLRRRAFLPKISLFFAHITLLHLALTSHSIVLNTPLTSLQKFELFKNKVQTLNYINIFISFFIVFAEIIIVLNKNK